MTKITKNTQLQILFICLLFCSTATYAQVGIGNNNPQSVLDISSSNQTTPANTDGILIPRIDNFSATNPGAAQDGMIVFVTGSGTPSRGFYYWEQSSTSWIPFGGSDWSLNGNAGTIAGTNFLGTTDVVDVVFKHANVEKARITSDETFFVNEITVRDGGTTSGNFLVRADDNNNNNDGRLRIYRNNSVNISLSGQGESVFNEVGNAASDFRIESNNLANMFFVNAGTNRIGINNNNPSYQFEINNNGNIGATALSQSTNTGTSGVAFSSYNTSDTNGYNALEGISNYNGTGFLTAGVYGLSINTGGIGIGVHGYSNSDDGTGVEGGFIGGTTFVPGWAIYANGWAGGLTAWQNVSDKRLKKNIKTIDGALEKLLKLRGVEYNFDKTNYPDVNFDTETKKVGFIAQEVEDVFPNLVRESYIYSSPTKAEKYSQKERHQYLVKTLSYSNIVPITVEAIKEQQKIIKSQNSKIKSLEKKLADLEAKVNSLLEN